MVGQVATNGRLEVTALGDAMNEAARIEGSRNRKLDPRIKGADRAAEPRRRRSATGSTRTGSITGRWAISTDNEEGRPDAGPFSVDEI